MLREEDFENWDLERVMECDGIMLLGDLARIMLLEEAQLLAELQEGRTGLIRQWQRWFVDLSAVRERFDRSREPHPCDRMAG